MVRVWHDVETPVEGDLIRFATTFASPDWDESPLTDTSPEIITIAQQR